ncbi:MAG: preprotein translocase subunit SecA, partial [Candidatus Jacksonbacteria bacterium]
MFNFKKLFSDPNKKVLADLASRVQEINNLEHEFEKKTDEQLRQLTFKFKQEIAAQKSNEAKTAYLDQILPQAFAAVREAAKRTLSQRHYDVQIMGSIVLHQGNIAEMKTGEGKTLASTMPVYLNALLGRGVHIVTVNEYLARRDASWMGQIYNFLGLTVACLQQQGNSLIYDEATPAESAGEPAHNESDIHAYKVDQKFLKSCTRQEAYQADITYGTNSEFGFDYLRDNMAQALSDKVQHGHFYAIVDEVDSILIDEARTPLIISAPDAKSADLYKKFAHLAPMLEENKHYNKDEERHAVALTEEGIKKMETLLAVQNIYTEDVTLAHQLDQALKAHVLYKIDRDYVVKDGEIIIVDQFTGRLQPGRRYSQGLHQAIEAKENVEIKQESKTLATITIQNYFRMYQKLAGMTGTAATEAEEFHKIYKLDVTSIPTNKLVIRHDKQDLIYKSEAGKFKALMKAIKAKYEKGQPVLVGTISIEKNELLSRLLKSAAVPHQILNAKQHEKEAEIIAQAGKLKAVTIATNMAGRGVDIVLGGNPQDPKETEEVKKLGGLFVFGSERHEARRIDNQLRGRGGRQGDPGESQFFISMEDDLMRIFGSGRIKGMMDRLGLPEEVPIENRIISRSIEKAQTKVEGHNFDIRKHLVEYDDVINKQRAAVYARRDKILQADSQDESLSEIILKMVYAEIKRVVEFHTAEGKESNIKEIQEVLQSIPLSITNYAMPCRHDMELLITNLDLQKAAEEQYQELSKDLDLELKRNIEKTLLLRTIDSLWVNHLDAVENLRVGIGLRGYGQRDPLVEYKREAYEMYQALLAEIDKQVVYNIYKIFLAYKEQIKAQEKLTPMMRAASAVLKTAQTKHGTTGAFGKSDSKTGDPYAGGRHDDQGSDSYVPQDRDAKTGRKIGRNDPCPCQSGKKYKKCCGK